MTITLTHLGKKFDDGKIMCYFNSKGHACGFIRLMTLDEAYNRVDQEYELSEHALHQIIEEWKI